MFFGISSGAPPKNTSNPPKTERNINPNSNPKNKPPIHDQNRQFDQPQIPKGKQGGGFSYSSKQTSNNQKQSDKPPNNFKDYKSKSYGHTEKPFNTNHNLSRSSDNVKEKQNAQYEKNKKDKKYTKGERSENPKQINQNPINAEIPIVQFKIEDDDENTQPNETQISQSPQNSNNNVQTKKNKPITNTQSKNTQNYQQNPSINNSSISTISNAQPSQQSININNSSKSTISNTQNKLQKLIINNAFKSTNIKNLNQQNSIQSIDTKNDKEIDHSLHFCKNSKQLDKRFTSTQDLINLGLCDYNGNLNSPYFDHSLNKFDMQYPICKSAYQSGICDSRGYPFISIERKDIHMCNNSFQIDKRTRSFKDLHSLGLCNDNGDLTPRYLDSQKTKFDMNYKECKKAYEYGYCDKNGHLHKAKSMPEDENLFKEVYLRKNSNSLDKRHKSFKDFYDLNLCDSNGELNQDLLVDEWRLDLRRPNCNQAYQMRYCDDYGRIYINGRSLPEFEEYSEENLNEKTRIYQPVSLNFSKQGKSKQNLTPIHTNKPAVVYNYKDFLPKHDHKQIERNEEDQNEIILRNVEIVNGPKKNLVKNDKQKKIIEKNEPLINSFESRIKPRKIFRLDENKIQSLLNPNSNVKEDDINDDLPNENRSNQEIEMPLIKFLFTEYEKESKVLVIVILILFYCFLLMK